MAIRSAKLRPSRKAVAAQGDFFSNLERRLGKGERVEFTLRPNGPIDAAQVKSWAQARGFGYSSRGDHFVVVNLNIPTKVAA